MRLRLFLSFTLTALVSIAILLIVVRQSAIQEVQTFMFRGGHGRTGWRWLLDWRIIMQAITPGSGADHLLDLTGQGSGNRRGNRGGQPGFGGMMGGMMNQRYSPG